MIEELKEDFEIIRQDLKSEDSFLPDLISLGCAGVAVFVLLILLG